MEQEFSEIAEQLFSQKLLSSTDLIPEPENRAPVHVVYGGANLFKAETFDKLGRLALKSLEAYASNFVELANAVWLKGAETLPRFKDVIEKLEADLTEKTENVKKNNYDAWFAWTIYQRIIWKLQTEPIEDFRIDFEDGYGIRHEPEEDFHAVSASKELAKAFVAGSVPAFCGFRIKSFQNETYRRAVRTLNLFLNNFIEQTGGRLPENFVVTLPKITRATEVEVLAELLEKFEIRNGLPKNSIKVEIMIETPQAVLQMREIVKAGRGRVNSAHFGAFDYTASFSITANHQHLQHDACRFARQMMQLFLAPMNIRLSDSVTTEMPVPVHRGEKLSTRQIAENRQAVHSAWRKHFNNVTLSLINGFYQGWDLHPAQLVARYAALYAFFLESADEQAERLKNFIGKATQAMLTGNLFDDAASAQGLINFFLRALSCGAMSEREIQQKTGLNAAELKSASFTKIMENRR
jgi:hypothetical protein